MIRRTIQIVPDAAAIARESANRIVKISADNIARKGSFSIALSGGSSPKAMYTLLAAEPFKSQIDWGKWDVFWGDERCVPPDHQDSNYKMAVDAMLSKVPVKAENIHRMKGEIDPNTAATEYGQLLKAKFADGGMDLVLLGMGPDGHTLSLFPGTTALSDKEHRCVSNWVEKFKTFRVTFTARFSNKARQLMAMVGGQDKKERMQEVLNGPYDPTRLPIQLIDPAPNGGELIWIMDKAAAGTDAGGKKS